MMMSPFKESKKLFDQEPGTQALPKTAGLQPNIAFEASNPGRSPGFRVGTAQRAPLHGSAAVLPARDLLGFRHAAQHAICDAEKQGAVLKEGVGHYERVAFFSVRRRAVFNP